MGDLVGDSAPQKNPLDFGGNRDHVTLQLGLRLTCDVTPVRTVLWLGEGRVRTVLWLGEGRVRTVLWLVGGRVIPCSSGSVLRGVCLIVTGGNCWCLAKVCALLDTFLVMILICDNVLLSVPTRPRFVVMELSDVTSVLLSWQPPRPAHGVITGYSVGYYKSSRAPAAVADDDAMTVVVVDRPSSLFYNVTSLQPYTTYHLQVLLYQLCLYSPA